MKSIIWLGALLALLGWRESRTTRTGYNGIQGIGTIGINVAGSDGGDETFAVVRGIPRLSRWKAGRSMASSSGIRLQAGASCGSARRILTLFHFFHQLAGS